MGVEEIYGDLPVLETERLILRKITMDDAEDMFLYASDDEVSRFVPWETHRTIENTLGYISFVVERYENKTIAPWGIEYKENGRMIGTVDFVFWKPEHQVAELGYVLGKDYWGKGIITEAAAELLRFAFTKMDLVRIQARCIADNTGSSRVMEKIGMTYEGTQRKAEKVKGTHRDFKWYAILKEDYEQRF
ncbi:GNAT family N-acetyltransferase [Paenibacillus dakarensis]|uniref:GNAT family N-acetyltransferase n=1 Tax=Paenibacillus dakarensis TaxID=1527293 RepID=UPI0006D591D5|nr:GNAT family protein [Paenibacillus dakarensis]